MRKIYSLLILLLLAGSYTVQAQPYYSWTAASTTSTTYSTNILTGRGVTTDAQGNVYTVGTYASTVDFDPGTGTTNLVSASTITTDIFIHKLDASGSLVWAKSIGGSSTDVGYGIAVDGSGNVYTTGSFSGTADFDPGSGTSNLTSAGGSDIFILKLNASGDYVWAKRMGSINDDIGYGIAVDGSANVYTTGSFTGTTGSSVDFDPGAGTANLTVAGLNDIYIQKLTASGDYVWAKRMGASNNDNGRGIAVDGSGNVYTTGSFQGTVDFDPGTGTANLTGVGGDDIFIQKLTASGDYVWAKRMGGVSGDVGYGIAVDGSGNVYTTGTYGSTVDFDPGSGTANLAWAGNTDIFIQKLDASGSFLWAKGMGGLAADFGFGIAVDGSGNVYTTGSFNGTVDFDPGSGTANLASAGGLDIFIQKLNASGNYVWAKNMGGTTGDAGYGIAVEGSGNVYTTGYFRNTANMNPVGGTDSKTGNIFGIFTQKLSQCSSISLANNTDNQSLITTHVGGAYLEYQASCAIIARLQPNGSSPVIGSTTAKVWVEATQPAQYVKRHYEITAANNASTATGRVTLYFTQAEFDDFNAISATKLPTVASDITGIGNLRIEKRPGTSSDGSGLPNTYTGTPVTINPADADIVWNATLSRWEVSFDVAGFSGFFVKTISGVLPLKWLSINGNLNAQKQAVIGFKVNETNVANYHIEKSYNGNSFTSIATMNSKGNGENNYQFTDATVVNGTLYYRIKQVDIDGRFSYSAIIRLSNKQIGALSVYPNPAKDIVTISGTKAGTKAQLTDMSGKVLQQINITATSFAIDMSNYNSGIYLLKTEEATQKIIKE